MSLQHRDCYGCMFPDLSMGGNELKGHVFSIEFAPVVGMLKPHAEARANVEEWDNCRKCEEFSHCLDFSTAKLAFQAAVPQM